MIRFVSKSGVAAFVVAIAASLGAGGAFAQDIPPGCVRGDNPNGAAQGAAIGGLTGAVLGNLGSSPHQKTQNTLLGGVAGAVAGAVIGGASSQGVSCPQGFVYSDAPPPAPVDYDEAPPAPRGDFWYKAPQHIQERIAFLRHRVERMDEDGFLSPRERDRVLHRLGELQRAEEHIRDRHEGRLPPEDRARLVADLDEVASHLRWQEYRDGHPDRY